MNAISAIMAAFSLLGALDRILGNRLGLGRKFEKGLMLLGPLALSMIGMIVLSPLLARLLQPASDFIYRALRIDPSLLPSLLFANDMGGGSLAAEIAQDDLLGRFNGLVVASMMGCTISFTIPYALQSVKPAQHEYLLLGLLCGIVTIPVGCFLGGMTLGVPLGALALNMLPLLLVSALLATGLLLFPQACTRAFGLLGTGIKILITIGLMLGIFQYLTGIELIEGLVPLEEAAALPLSAAVVLTGAFPLLALVSRLLGRPLARLSQKVGINRASAMGLLSTLAASMTTFEQMQYMDDKGVLLNSAFCVSAAFLLADHLAFTLAFDAACLPGVMVGKLTAGLSALVLAHLLSGRFLKKKA